MWKHLVLEALVGYDSLPILFSENFMLNMAVCKSSSLQLAVWQTFSFWWIKAIYNVENRQTNFLPIVTSTKLKIWVYFCAMKCWTSMVNEGDLY